MIEWLNTNSGAVQAMAVVILILVTAWYALSNWRLVKATKEQTRPYILVDFQMTQISFDVLIANLGDRPAKNVRFKVDKDITIVRRRDDKEDEIKFSKLPAIEKGWGFFPANRRYRFAFSRPHELFGKSRAQQGLELSGKVTYKYGNESFEEPFAFDLSIYRERMYYEHEEHQLSQHLRGIESALRDLKPTRGVISVSEMLNTTRCPICQEPISKDARKCPRCHEWIKTPEHTAEQQEDKSSS